jgi:hypothetical protein
VFARQPCDPIPRPRDVGQWLCVPPFRVVCLYQAFTLAVKDVGVTERNNDGIGQGVQPGGLLGSPAKALHAGALTSCIVPAGISAMSRGQVPCQRLAQGADLLWGPQSTGGHAEGLEARGGKMARGPGKNCVAWGPGGQGSRRPSALHWEAPT